MMLAATLLAGCTVNLGAEPASQAFTADELTFFELACNLGVPSMCDPWAAPTTADAVADAARKVVRLLDEVEYADCGEVSMALYIGELEWTRAGNPPADFYSVLAAAFQVWSPYGRFTDLAMACVEGF